MSICSKRKHDPFVLKLLEEIKNHECLWNVNFKGFHHKGVTRQAWTDIANKLDKKEPVIRSKWRNLKDTYRKELKKNNMDDGFRGTAVWLYSEHMEFIRKFMDVGDASESETIEGFTIDDSQPFLEEHSSMSYVILKEENNYTPPVESRITEKNLPTIKFVNSNDEIVLAPKTNTADDVADEEQVYDEQFLISLLPFFRRLDPIRKLAIRSKIQAAVAEELTRNLRDPISN